MGNLILNALLVQQCKALPIYVFGVDGRVVHQIASVSCAERTRDGALSGYQRPQVKKHIEEILSYLSSEGAILPNAIVVAFDERVKFEALANVQRSEWGTFGRLHIPIPRNASESRAGWIVDGQQRATALARLDPSRNFPVVVAAFQSGSQRVQREQFLLVNKTKPLPRDLIAEILPEVSTNLPRDLQNRQVATQVLKEIRFSKASPFYQRVRGLGGDEEGANISQAAILAVVQNSIRSKGVLFDCLGSAGVRHNVSRMAQIVMTFFEGVRRTWPKEWDGSPTTSRLVHGVGIVSLGHLMDRVMLEVDPVNPKAAAMVVRRLNRLATRCAWAKGRWPKLGCNWNELQNTSQDKARLTAYILKEYGER